MSLLSNRGRFSAIEKTNNFHKDTDLNSALSSRGVNPQSLFKIDKDKLNADNKSTSSFVTNQNTKKSFDDNFVDNKFITKHYEFNNSIEKFQKKKKNKVGLIVAMVIVELFTLVGIACLGTFIRVSNMTQKVSFDKSAVKNTNIDESTLAIMKGYKTVAIFGVDSRTGSVDKGNNSDVNLIVNLNLENGEAELVSVYRDLYLSITDGNSYDKLNAAYRKGGPEAAVKALNKNLDLNIENFFSFNWKAVADGIELLGGIDLEISKAEYKYMNAFIHETCIATGIDSKNPAAHYIHSAGMQHLDGVQSVAYGRLRLMDSDFQRVERQKKVISLCLEKAKELDIPKLRLIMEAVLPQIAYEFDMNEMLSILRIVKKINIIASCGVPETNNVVTMDMGSSGDSVVPLNLEKAVMKLHKVLYDKDDYSPSIAVKRYSNRITELRLKYQEENKIKASIKASEEEASKLAELKPKSKKATRSTVTKLRRSSKSNVGHNDDEDVDTDPNRDLNDVEDIVPIMDGEDYEDEPEEDEENDKVIDEKIEHTNESEKNVAVNKAPWEEASDSSEPKKISIPGELSSPGKSNTENNAPVSSGPISEPNRIIAPGDNNSIDTSNSIVKGAPTGNETLNNPSNNKMPDNNVGVVVSGPPTG